jgi:hypothetical protein
VQRPVAQMPWRQNLALLEGVKEPTARLWYAEQTLAHGWSQAILKLQIERRAHERAGKAITNFDQALPPAESDLAAQIFKDPYLFDSLKVVPFEPEFAGKLNFYLSAVDDLLRHPDDKPSIGLLLCKSKNRVVVEYALRDLTKPIGVAQWETQIVASLPKELEGSLPTVAEIEAELGGGS